MDRLPAREELARREIRETVSVPGWTTYEEDGAIVLVFRSGGRCRIDLLARPMGNTVRTRRC